MTCKNPFSTHSENSEEIKLWTELLDNFPDLVRDMAVGSKQWGDSLPWDDIHRDQYVEKEVPVEERSREEMQAAVNRHWCRKSEIELGHLEREKSSPPAVINSETPES
jgi:hypothetical protein